MLSSMETNYEILVRRSRKDPETGCWLVGKGDYPQVRGRRANRAMWEAVNGPIPQGLFICHTCDRPSCVNPDHLFARTPAQHSADRVAKNRIYRGGHHPASKVNRIDMILPVPANETLRALARRWGLDRQDALLRLLDLPMVKELANEIDR